MIASALILALIAVLLAALLSAGAIPAIYPLLLKYALAKPNARSSHRMPTPQGAGIAVVAATLTTAAGALMWFSTPGREIPALVLAAALFIATVGFADDLRSIPIVPRLVLQTIAVAAVLFFGIPAELRLVPACPWLVERGLTLLAGLWFVNLVNFMDGLDWMTAAEVVPVTAAIVILGLIGDLPVQVIIIAAALCGAMLGFAPFNRPKAKVFLGDVGSLPIGLLVGWCLLEMAYRGQFAAALMLPLYYLADATLTLLRRMLRREEFWSAHRSHFYQRATDNGFTVMQVVCRVFALNLLLAALAIASTMVHSTAAMIACIVAGLLAVAAVMYGFSQPRQPG
jgi:UDP-N-acetylmuramyl pentapeptide phosphotransferase/UDP-N-acetylglucosamine-1-phosphate transferase